MNRAPAILAQAGVEVMSSTRGSPPRPRTAFIVVAMGIFLSVLDLFIVNIAFPAMRREFAASTLTELAWVLTAYAVVFAAVLVPAGRLGDLYGRRRLFSIGLALFLIGSALSAAAPSLPFLVFARVIQAVGGAAMTPNSLGVILPIFPPQRRPAIIGAWAAIAGIGAAAGPVLGGVLAELSWRLIFLVNLPLGLIALVLVPRVVAEVRQEGEQTLPDLAGAALLIGSIGLLTLALSQGPSWAWDGRVLASVVASAIAGGAFVWRSARHAAPVVELPMLAVPSFALASAATVLFFGAFSALLVSNVLFLTGVWRLSVLEAGLITLPGPITAAILAALAGRLAGRIGSGRVGTIGGLVFGASAFWLLARMAAQDASAVEFMLIQGVGGLGIGMVLPALTAIAVGSIPAARLATGVGVQTMFRQIGGALCVAVWVATVGAATELRAADDFGPGWWFIGISAMVAGVILLATVPLARRTKAEDLSTVSTAWGGNQRDARRGRDVDGGAQRPADDPHPGLGWRPRWGARHPRPRSCRLQRHGGADRLSGDVPHRFVAADAACDAGARHGPAPGMGDSMGPGPVLVGGDQARDHDVTDGPGARGAHASAGHDRRRNRDGCANNGGRSPAAGDRSAGGIVPARCQPGAGGVQAFVASAWVATAGIADRRGRYPRADA